VRETAALPLPPTGAVPHGPTNLESALNQIADETDAAPPTQLLLLTDCDTQIAQPQELSRHLREKQISLHVLALGQGSALGIIRQIAAETGGNVIQQMDPGQWSRSVEALTQAAMPERLMHQLIGIQFINEAKLLANDSTSVWNRTWLKSDADEWAHGTGVDANMPMAAWRRFGDGCVAAAAFRPSPKNIEKLVQLIAQRPRDPRFSVQWETDREIRVIVDAVDQGKFLNGISASLRIEGGGGVQNLPLSQTGPGRYEVAMDAPAHPVIATLRAMGEVIDRTSIAGRYPREFDEVGNDHAKMRLLATRSGGAVIWPADHGSIDFQWRRREVNLAQWICGVAMVFLAIGLMRARS
jgi:hypothetical protein